MSAPLFSVQGLTRRYGARIGCADVSFDLWPGEVLGIVGESGSGKSTLLSCISGQMDPDEGRVRYATRDLGPVDVRELSEPRRRMLMRTDWAFVHQNPRDGLRMTVSAGANVGERLMAVGARRYGAIRESATDWLGKVEIAVQARLLDLIRGLVRELGLSAIIVTHDLAVVRLLADRLMVMKDGGVVETGLTDQVLDDPQHPYTQLLVSSVLQA